MRPGFVTPQSPVVMADPPATGRKLRVFLPHFRCRRMLGKRSTSGRGACPSIRFGRILFGDRSMDNLVTLSAQLPRPGGVLPAHQTFLFMKPYVANLINAVVLITMGVWAYYTSDVVPAPVTALIPVAFGIIFLLATPLFKKQNKVVAHIVVLLTFVLIVALAAKPLQGALADDNPVRLFRVGLMMTTSIVALGVFIKNFIDVRKARQGA